MEHRKCRPRAINKDDAISGRVLKSTPYLLLSASHSAPAQVDQRAERVEGEEPPDGLAAANLAGGTTAKIVLRERNDRERDRDEPDDLSLFTWRALSEWCLRHWWPPLLLAGVLACPRGVGASEPSPFQGPRTYAWAAAGATIWWITRSQVRRPRLR